MVKVGVSEGILEGELVENEYGGTFYSFKGIPYAQPPVGELRFQAPRPLASWDGVRPAKKFGPVCYQFNIFTKSVPENGSEDCLYLNVYTPDLSPLKPIPVMFLIYGGIFISGSGNDDMYGPEYLVRKEVILVTFNYRVGALGYLCLDTKDVPGNAAMKDQVAALRWVKNNIGNFGGDPDNITIFGMSSGASSITFHLVSPMTKGLFKRAIVQSGTSACWFSEAVEPREKAIAIAKQLGLHTENDHELYEYLKKIPVEKLIYAQAPLTLADNAREPHELTFNVVSEKIFVTNEVFFHGDVIDTLREGVHDDVEVMIGYTEHEGLMLFHAINDFDKILEQANNFYDFFVSKPLALNCTIKDQIHIGKRIKQYYFGKNIITRAEMKQFINFYSITTFVYGIIQWVKICAASKKNNVYFYKFTCKSERNLISKFLGLDNIIQDEKVVCHLDDILYLFPMKLPVLNHKVDKNSRTFELIDKVTTLWTNFAKYGNPTPDHSLGVTWIPYTTEKQDYLIIGEQLVADNSPDQDEIEFWEKIFLDYYPHFVYKK